MGFASGVAERVIRRVAATANRNVIANRLLFTAVNLLDIHLHLQQTA